MHYDMQLQSYSSHLLLDVFKRRRQHTREAHQEDISVGVTQGPQSLEVLLARRVKQRQCVLVAGDVDLHRVVVEDSGYVGGRELVCCVGDEKTCFTHGSVADHHTFDLRHCKIWNLWTDGVLSHNSKCYFHHANLLRFSTVRVYYSAT